MASQQQPSLDPLENPVEWLSDEELMDYILNARKISERNDRVIEIPPEYVSKRYDADDFEDARRAITKAESLGVNVPAIRRAPQRGDRVECVQTRIEGSNLMDIWHELGVFSTLRLALQLRAMVRRMRRVTRPTAGSLGTGACRSMWLEDFWGVPPHASPSAVTSVLNFWQSFVSFRQEARKTPDQHRASCRSPLEPERDLVFTHTDLAPRNLVLESGTGRLWLVDWDYAGFYPRYFEYTGMHNFMIPKHWGWLARLRWRFFAWVATGSWAREARILEVSRSRAMRYGASRRFNIKAGATPSERTVRDD